MAIRRGGDCDLAATRLQAVAGGGAFAPGGPVRNRSSEDELRRAVDLYTELTAERTDDDRRWIALLRVQGKRGDAMGIEASLRRLRTALVELGQGDKPQTVRLPINVQRVLEEVQTHLSAPADTAVG